VVEYPQTLSIFLEQLHPFSFYVESFHEQLYRKFSMEHGNGMVPIELALSRSGRYSSRIITTTFMEISMKFEFIPEEFS
jgi:hypothetical protein